MSLHPPSPDTSIDATTLGTTATDCSCIVAARLQKRTMVLRMSRGLYGNDMNDEIVTIGAHKP